MRNYDITININVDAEDSATALAFVRESIDCAYEVEEIDFVEEDSDDHS